MSRQLRLAPSGSPVEVVLNGAQRELDLNAPARSEASQQGSPSVLPGGTAAVTVAWALACIGMRHMRRQMSKNEFGTGVLPRRDIKDGLLRKAQSVMHMLRMKVSDPSCRWSGRNLAVQHGPCFRSGIQPVIEAKRRPQPSPAAAWSWLEQVCCMPAQAAGRKR